VYNTTLDHRIQYEDGGVGYITVKVTVERDENGKITRYYGANQEITERKQAEVMLRESEQRYQQILDAITDMVLVKGDKSTIVWANRSFRDYYGMSNEELQNMIDSPIVDPDYTLQYVKDDARVFESGEVMQIPEEPVTRHDGSVRLFETVKAPIRDLTGDVVMTVGVSRDITERRKAQQEMAERLEEINRLYQNLSREGWKTYRETKDLPTGFMFDRTGLQPVDDLALTDERFAHIPMKVLGGEVVGNLAVAHDPEHPISKDDLDFLQQVSDQVALALEGARLSAQTQSALAQTEKLSEAGLQFTRASDLQTLVKIAAEMLDIPSVNRAALETFTYNAEDEVIGMDVIANWWSGTGHQPTAVGTHYTTEILPLLKLFLTSVPNFIQDAFQDERIDGVSMQIIRMLNVRAVAVLPLFLADRQLGVLLLESEQPHNFTQDEVRLFTAMGPQISTVLENRRQFERAQKQAERESTLNVISQKIQSATTVEAVLQIAARELGHALGAPMTIAQLSMKDKK
jgi:PAS domain S-box-containing protein